MKTTLGCAGVAAQAELKAEKNSTKEANVSLQCLVISACLQDSLLG